MKTSVQTKALLASFSTCIVHEMKLRGGLNWECYCKNFEVVREIRPMADKTSPVHSRAGRSSENSIAVREDADKSPNTYIRLWAYQ